MCCKTKKKVTKCRRIYNDEFRYLQGRSSAPLSSEPPQLSDAGGRFSKNDVASNVACDVASDVASKIDLV